MFETKEFVEGIVFKIINAYLICYYFKIMVVSQTGAS